LPMVNGLMMLRAWWVTQARPNLAVSLSGILMPRQSRSLTANKHLFRRLAEFKAIGTVLSYY